VWVGLGVGLGVGAVGQVPFIHTTQSRKDLSSPAPVVIKIHSVKSVGTVEGPVGASAAWQSWHLGAGREVKGMPWVPHLGQINKVVGPGRGGWGVKGGLFCPEPRGVSLLYSCRSAGAPGDVKSSPRLRGGAETMDGTNGAHIVGSPPHEPLKAVNKRTAHQRVKVLLRPENGGKAQR